LGTPLTPADALRRERKGLIERETRGGGRATGAGASVDSAASVFSDLSDASPIEAAFLIKPTGELLASWTRRDVRAEVVTVMAATLTSSVETLAEAFGCPTPKSFSVSTEHCNLVVRKIARDAVLLLFAPQNAPFETIDPLVRRLADRVSAPARARTRPQGSRTS